MKVAAFSGWIGAACMSCAPFIIDTPAGKALAIVGLGLLTIQAICNRDNKSGMLKPHFNIRIFLCTLFLI